MSQVLFRSLIKFIISDIKILNITNKNIRLELKNNILIKKRILSAKLCIFDLLTEIMYKGVPEKSIVGKQKLRGKRKIGQTIVYLWARQARQTCAIIVTRRLLHRVSKKCCHISGKQRKNKSQIECLACLEHSGSNVTNRQVRLSRT